MQPTLRCQLAINVNHSLDTPPPPNPHAEQTSQQLVFPCDWLRGPHMTLSEMERLGSERHRGRFHALDCLSIVEGAAGGCLVEN